MSIREVMINTSHELSLASLGIIAPFHTCTNLLFIKPINPGLLFAPVYFLTNTTECILSFPDQYHWMHFITIWIEMEGGLFIKCILYFHLYDLYVSYIVSISLWSMKVNEEGRKRSPWTLNNEHPANDKLLLYDICI